ncbi:hypothetical protein, partial [Xanthomonas hortorum]|uniref:hypothetical protein n=1 Tax=Xanthomonas hortorum TaxID=56454 RepID=UPI000ABCB05D
IAEGAFERGIGEGGVICVGRVLRPAIFKPSIQRPDADDLAAHNLAAHNKTGSLGYPLFACIRPTAQ